MSSLDSAEISHFFFTHGLNLCAVFDTAQLPTTIRQQLAAEVDNIDAYQRLVLLGNAGKHLWRFFERNGIPSNDPFDRHSIQVVKRFAAEKLLGASVLSLYPYGPMIPLQQLGRLAGWHHDSPLGLGIHASYGVWFAYRAAFLVDAQLPLIQEQKTVSPCDSCVSKPCLSACPAGAVRGIGRFSVSTCASHRLKPDSECATQCLSRLACPVAPEHRYPDEQISYHYAQSLKTIKQWYG